MCLGAPQGASREPNASMSMSNNESTPGQKPESAPNTPANPGNYDANSITALEGLGSQSYGGFTVTFSPTDHVASSFVELSMLTGDGRVRT